MQSPLLTSKDRTARLPNAITDVRWVSLGIFIEKENQTMLKTQPRRIALNASLLVAIFISLFFDTSSAFALGSGASPLPSFADFSTSVQNGDASVLRGVYVPDVMALPIVQQPAGNAAYVSTDDSRVTQFKMASQYGNIGLLAHNYLSGKLFPQLTVGQEVRLVYGNGKVEYFVISEVLQYQALQPTSPYSSFHNLNKDETLTAEQMFKRVYFGDRHITFQTCIAKDGNSSWGRLFVIAIPKPQVTSVDRFDRQVVQ
jgi:hypothetical protein